jgi:hypothetical protein
MRRVTDQIAIRPAWIRPLLPGAAAWCCCRDRIRCPVRRYARFGVMPGSALCPVRRYARFGVMPGSALCLDRRYAWIGVMPGSALCLDRRYAWIGVMPGSALCLDRIRCRAEKRRAGQRARETGRQAPIGRVAAGIGRNARIRPFTC